MLSHTCRVKFVHYVLIRNELAEVQAKESGKELPVIIDCLYPWYNYMVKERKGSCMAGSKSRQLLDLFVEI